MTSKPDDICNKFPFMKIKKCEGVADDKLIRKIEENTSAILSELGRGKYGLLGL